MQPTLSSISLWAAFASTTVAWGGFGEYLVDDLAGVSAASAQWEGHVAYSNASSTVTFPGRDVTKPYPASVMEGWTINVTALDLRPDAMGWDVRVIAPESLYSTVDPEKIANDTDANNARLAHGKVIKDVDPSWAMCFYVSYGGQSYEAPSKEFKDLPNKPDGDCSPWISDECIKALEKTASTSWDTDDTYKHWRVNCYGFEKPKECDAYDLDFGLAPELPIRYLTGQTTQINGFEFAKDKEDEEFDAPLKNATLIWESMTRDVNFVITMFGHYQGPNTTEPEPGITKVSCIRPQLNEAASKKDDKKNAASNLYLSPWAGLVAGAVVVWLSSV